jgi:hypothetical protein
MSDKKGNNGCFSKGRWQLFGTGALIVLLVLGCAVPEEMGEQTGSVEGDVSLLATMMCPFMIFMFVFVYLFGRRGGGGSGRGLG